MTRDYVKAVELYSASAQGGYVVAIFNLGVMWENGVGLEQDFGKAAQLYKAAADVGLAAAQYNLGVLCFVSDVSAFGTN